MKINKLMKVDYARNSETVHYVEAHIACAGSTNFISYMHSLVQVELFRNDQHRLKIVVDGENEVDLMVQTRHLRDVIVLVIRGLAQRFNSTSLNTLLKIDT